MAAQLGPALVSKGHLLPAEVAAGLRPQLKLALAAAFGQGGGLPYTNIALSRAATAAVLGGWLDDSDTITAGEKLLDQWMNYTARFGLHEYESTDYFWNDLNAMLPSAQHAPTKRLRLKFAAVADYLFALIAVHFFPPTNALAGAHSRDYTFLNGRFPNSDSDRLCPGPSCLGHLAGSHPCDGVHGGRVAAV